MAVSSRNHSRVSCEVDHDELDFERFKSQECAVPLDILGMRSVWGRPSNPGFAPFIRADGRADPLNDGECRSGDRSPRRSAVLPVTWVRNGSDGFRDGVGSARRVKVAPLPTFEESVTEFRPDELIRYRLSRDSLVGSVVTDHEGVMRFSTVADGVTRLHYVIVFHARIPGLAAVGARVLQRRIAAGLAAIAGSLETTSEL